MTDTPMMRQYSRIKSGVGDALLFFRMGDFYEMFGEDAQIASKVLDLTLTSRDKNADIEDRIPMCGVPYHAADSYIERLVKRGYKIAICEQTEDPSQAKGLVDREVVRIITPGTLTEPNMLDEGRANYLCSVYIGQNTAVCFADLSTGEISVTNFESDDTARLESALSAYTPSEFLLNSRASKNLRLTNFIKERLNCLSNNSNEYFEYKACKLRVDLQFPSPEQELCYAAYCAVGAVLIYLEQTQKSKLTHFTSLHFSTSEMYMELDNTTIRNLELVSTIRTNDKRGSLLGVIDRTSTPMGKRLLRAWVLRPLRSCTAVLRRLAATQELCDSVAMRQELVYRFRSVGDLERLIGKIAFSRANPRDLISLASGISELPKLKAVLMSAKTVALLECGAIDPLFDIASMIRGTLSETPPYNAREGGVIRDGADPEVDRLRHLLNDSEALLEQIETRERERTGKRVKVGYNRVTGYYLELPRSVSDNVPEDYIRKQTLANSERFVTDELKSLESELLSAKEKLEALETKLFTELCATVSLHVSRVQSVTHLIAVADVFCSFAELALTGDYVMPEVDLSGVIEIREGRHPVVERTIDNTLFVPNDTLIGEDYGTAQIITGPNMAGKSTYMRQTALIVLLAQIGSFVPAKSARIGIVDRIFTRIGASDDLSAGMSTFMVEMTEVAEILKHATRNSLIILDEVGRGTSTYDGMAVARACLEYCVSKRGIGAKTMFATHYHELSRLEDELQGVVNYNITAKKRGEDLVFLRKIVRGAADDSYGIEVAALAGLPRGVVQRAKSVLKALEDQGLPQPVRKKKQEDDQMSLAHAAALKLAETLANTDLNTITPIEAMSLLYDLKKKL